RRASSAYWLLLFGVMVPSTVVSLFLRLGNKTFLILVLGLPLIAYWYVRRRVPWKSLTVVALIVVFVVFPLYYGYRRVQGNSYTRAYRVEKAIGILSKEEADVYAGNALTSVAKRFAIINSTAVVVRDCGSR